MKRYEVKSQEKHNPYYKLVSKLSFNNKGKAIELVYGVTNEGINEGLEVYFYNDFGGFHSRRYTNNDYPAKYRTEFVMLRQLVRDGLVKDGHKAKVN